VALHGLAFGINYLQLTRLAKSGFERTYVDHLLTRRSGRCRFYLGLSSIVPLAVNWNVGACNFKLGVSVDRVRGRRWDRLENPQTF
jgi:hypothetical protein